MTLRERVGRVWADGLRSATAEPWRRTGVAVARTVLGGVVMLRGAPLPFGARHIAAVTRLAASHTAGGPPSRLMLGLVGTTVGIAGLGLILVAAGLCLVANTRARAAAATAAMALLALFRGLPEIALPGDHFLLGALVYLIPMAHVARRPLGRFAIWLHNVATIGLVAQATILVLLLGFARAHAPNWHNGTALYLLAQQHEQPTPAFVQDLVRNPVLATVFTYFVLLGSLWYPVYPALGWRARGLVVSGFGLVQLALCLFPPLAAISVLIIGASAPILSDSHYDLVRRGWAAVRRGRFAAGAPAARERAPE